MVEECSDQTLPAYTLTKLDPTGPDQIGPGGININKCGDCLLLSFGSNSGIHSSRLVVDMVHWCL